MSKRTNGRGSYYDALLGAGRGLGDRFGGQLVDYGKHQAKDFIDRHSDRIPHGGIIGGLAKHGVDQLGMMSGRGLYTGNSFESPATRKNVSLAVENANSARLSGRGDYVFNGHSFEPDNIVQNNLFSESNGLNPASFMSDKAGVFVQHKEYLGDIYAAGVANSGIPTPFINSSYSLNPALQYTFPWLSQIAQNYESYQFEELIFSFESTTNELGSNSSGQCGTIIMCTQYNASASPFEDKGSMVEYEGSETCKVTESMLHVVDCQPSDSALSTLLFTRANPVLSDQDVKTYDLGIFQIAVCNCPVGYNGFPVGELYVSYKVRLNTPKLFVSRGLEIDQDQFITTLDDNVNQVTPFGTQYGIFSTTSGTISQPDNSSYWLRGQQNNIGIQRCVYSANNIAFVIPPNYVGNLEITVWTVSTNAGYTEPFLLNTLTLIGNVIAVSDMYGGCQSSDASSTTAPPVSTLFSAGNSAVNSQGCFQVFHIWVGQACGGVNNSFVFNYTNSAFYTALQYQRTCFRISQYQAFGASTSAPSIAWVNNLLQPAAP